MQLSAVIAQHLRGVFFGGNWTASNLKNQLLDVDWKMATAELPNLNSIVVLTYHIGYFVGVQLEVVRGGPLEGSDTLSFDHPPIENQADWENMCSGIFSNAEALAEAVGQLSDEQLSADFVNPKYGTYYANIVGMIEHTHYHLGQIALIKKLAATNKQKESQK